MKALTLHQPWASLIAIGAKRIETRSWSTTYRGPLAIHAAVRPVDLDAWNAPGKKRFLAARREDNSYWLLGASSDHGPVPLPLGCIVATCELVDVVPILAAFPWPKKPPQKKWIAVGGVDRPDNHLRLIWAGDTVLKVFDPAYGNTNEFPFGDFTPGRFAWLLDNIVALDEPIPARGRQGLWSWEA